MPELVIDVDLSTSASPEGQARPIRGASSRPPHISGRGRPSKMCTSRIRYRRRPARPGTTGRLFVSCRPRGRMRGAHRRRRLPERTGASSQRRAMYRPGGGINMNRNKRCSPRRGRYDGPLNAESRAKRDCRGCREQTSTSSGLVDIRDGTRVPSLFERDDGRETW